MLTRTTRYAVLIYRSLCDSITHFFRRLFKRKPVTIHFILVMDKKDNNNEHLSQAKR